MTPDPPELFLRPPPPGLTRESRIRLDREGRFWHEGARVEHPGLQKAFSAWVARHPVDGRYVLQNGQDWCYLEVEDTPFQVVSVVFGPSGEERPEGEGASGGELLLSDGTSEPLEPSLLAVDDEGVLFATVKAGHFEARFSRQAQLELGEALVEGDEVDETSEVAPPALALGGRRWRLSRRKAPR